MLIDREKAIAIIEKNALGMSWSESPSESGAGFELLKRAEALRALPVSDGVTDEMVERAAKALCEKLDAIENDWHGWTGLARAALEAALGPLPAPPTIE